MNGLSGIVAECTCKKYFTTTAKRTQSKHKHSEGSRHGKGLNGVLTAEEMANRKLDLLNFFSFWLTLFGSPAKNFTAMFHGEPHNGKTIFLLKLAQFLAENFGDVLYVSSEEFASPTMTKKVAEILKSIPGTTAFFRELERCQNMDL
jgi:predicted ATP-dependent serine protease